MTLPHFSTAELFLIAMTLIFALPYAVWRLGRTEYWAPLVVVQILTGVLLGPGVLGAAWPEMHRALFTPAVVQSLNGLAWWGVMVFVWVAGIELDLGQAWVHRRESAITAGLALGAPLLLGCGVAAGMLAFSSGWHGAGAQPWQFVVGVGMASAVTALPILILFMVKLNLLRQPLGQRILRYASLDDLAIWAVLALVLLDWTRVERQAAFLTLFAIAAYAFRGALLRVPERDRWALGLVWLALCGFAADWAGLHYMVGAFLAGAVLDKAWFTESQLDQLRDTVLLLLMPVFFLSTGLRTDWQLGGVAVLVAAFALLAAAVGGKLLGVHLAARVLHWPKGEAHIVGWLLQTKALIMIIFANVLLDKGVITPDSFTALLLMAVMSTMLTVPMVAPKLTLLRAKLRVVPPRVH